MKKLIYMVFVGTVLITFGVPLIILSEFKESRSDYLGQEAGITVRVLNKKSGEIDVLLLEQYLVGVVAAEMPANFEVEALKAQAVAARTYTVKRMFRFGAKPNPQHPDAEVCTDPTHCQAWTDAAEQKKKWGPVKSYLYWDRIKTAVNLTRGYIVTYNNQFIDPVYHGSCGGKGTENSEDVWSSFIPYLRSVDCDREYKAAEQKVIASFDKSKFRALFNESHGVLPVTSVTGEIIKPLKKSQQGRVQEAMVFGNKISGINLRRALGLSSTYMDWRLEGEKIIFTSTGKGHAVGMCQYGANGLALEDKSFLDILKHYYTGVTIKKLKY